MRGEWGIDGNKLKRGVFLFEKGILMGHEGHGDDDEGSYGNN